MSTPENASARNGSQHEDDTITHSPRLPTFAPIREPPERRISKAESSASSSRKSAADFQKRSRSSLRESLSFRGSDGVDGEGVSPTSSRRIINRSSGGFLLESATRHSRTSNGLLARSHRDLKGKRKSEESEISLSKRRTRTSILDHDTSIGSSPLAVEVRHDEEFQVNREAGSGRDYNQESGQGADNDEGSRAKRSNMHQRPMPAVGYDTDPAQIVDMALRLSEGRRRHASGKRYMSGDIPGRRIVSSASTNYSRNVTPTKNLGQYLASSQPTSTSPPENGPTATGDAKPVDSQHPLTSYGLEQGMDNILEISRATASRVEKARTYLELAYEHRRLLAHLPPIRRPDDLSTAKDIEPKSRVYNPLQYVRNRKLRLREKSAINGEVTGWHDVEKVRTWVDTVIDSHTETKHDPLECVRLPPLSDEATSSDVEKAQPQSSLIPPHQRGAKARRPKSDWVTHPGDIIADAHWLEQGLNKTKIQDRDNNPIYPPNTQFKFSGWRNVTPLHVPDGLQEPTPPPEDDFQYSRDTPPLEDAPVLPTFRSSHQKKSKKDKKQQSNTNTFRKTLVRASRRPKKTAAGHTDDSESDTGGTSSTDSEGAKQHRGRKRSTANHNEFNLVNGDPFGRPVESKHNGRQPQPTNTSDPNLSGHSSKPSIEQNKLIDFLKRSSTNRGSFSDREPSIKQERPGSERLARESFEYDSTAPTSPTTERWPSIAINLSPPHSRSPSPTKRGKTSILHSLLDRNHSQSRERVDTTDFALPASRSHSREPSTDTEARRDSSDHRSRGTSPRTRGPSPLTKLSRASTVQDDPSSMPPSAPLEHRSSTMSRVSTRSGMHAGDQSRIRGIFKGGRIAELVGNEVTRVGDFIWKRDPPAATGVSSEMYDTSDTDDEPIQNGSAYKTPTRDGKSSTSTHSSPKESRLSQDSPRSSETPQYYNPNLPSFTSPFQKDRERQDQKRGHLNPESALTGDHISHAAAEHRSRSKSPRMDRLAPPKLNIGGGQSTGVDMRRGSYGFGAVLDLTKPRTASQSFNDAINGATDHDHSGSNSVENFSRQLHDSVVNMPETKKGTISKQDVCRIEALLLMSAVKAKGLVAVQNAILPNPSRFLKNASLPDTDGGNEAQPLRIRRREEHVLAARKLISTLGEQSSKMNDELTTFSGTTITTLQKELQVFEDRIENNLTPRVRAAADSAGELSQKLTTTSTMAVKSVNDMVSEAFRMRQRGPFRWLRSVGYGAIEWAVVGLLWLIWFVVMIIRSVLGVMRGVVQLGRWLLWLN